MPRVCPDADGGRARQMHNINTCWVTGADPGFEKGGGAGGSEASF